MRPKELDFVKLSAAGNRYVAIDARGLDLDWSELAREISDDSLGVSSDGVVLCVESERAEFGIRILNSDGSEAEMSGNGLRLFAKFLVDSGLVDPLASELRIETKGGLRTVWPQVDNGKMISGRINMGTPSFDPRALPSDVSAEDMKRLSLALPGRRLTLTCLSLGNPHAVAILSEPISDFPLDEVGPLVENHSLFPNRVNFEIVNVVDRRTLRARIFERGEGETASSGTGSTASAVACRVQGLTDDEVAVSCRGGELQVQWPGHGDAFLSGPTDFVGAGRWWVESSRAEWL